MKSSFDLTKAMMWILLLFPIGIKYLPATWQTENLKVFSNLYIIVMAITVSIVTAQRILAGKNNGDGQDKNKWVYLLVIIGALLIAYFNVSAFVKVLNKPV